MGSNLSWSHGTADPLEPGVRALCTCDLDRVPGSAPITAVEINALFVAASIAAGGPGAAQCHETELHTAAGPSR